MRGIPRGINEYVAWSGNNTKSSLTNPSGHGIKPILNIIAISFRFYMKDRPSPGYMPHHRSYHNSSLWTVSFPSGRQRAGVVTVNWYSHFSNSVISTSRFSVPHERRSLKEYPSASLFSTAIPTHDDIAFRTIPAPGTMFVGLFGIIVCTT